MKAIPNWRSQLNRLWSVRVAIFTALLASADSILGLFTDFIPPITYAILAAVIIIARVVQQPEAHT